MIRGGFLEKIFYKKEFRGIEVKDGKKYKKYKKVPRFSGLRKRIILYLVLIILLLGVTAVFVLSCHNKGPHTSIEVISE